MTTTDQEESSARYGAVELSSVSAKENEKASTAAQSPDESSSDEEVALRHSLPEFHGTISVPNSNVEQSWFQILRSYLGPGALIAVGYMDPGNWSTDIAGGSAYGYQLLSIVLLSSLMAMFLQYLALKVGLVTGQDLAQLCRRNYSPFLSYSLWISMEVAIIATDLAEVIGSAVALKLLFDLPLVLGVCLTSLDILLFLFLSGNRFQFIESFVVALIAIITACFLLQLVFSQPALGPVMLGFVPSTSLVTNRGMLFVAVGIIGATVMPHNLFLHSAIVLTRTPPKDAQSLAAAVTYCTVDSNVSLTLAFFVNAAILIVSAATFHTAGYENVATLQEAYRLLQPLLHTQLAPVLFGVALLASGQNSTLTGTLTGQIIMEGFLSGGRRSNSDNSESSSSSSDDGSSNNNSSDGFSDDDSDRERGGVRRGGRVVYSALPEHEMMHTHEDSFHSLSDLEPRSNNTQQQSQQASATSSLLLFQQQHGGGSSRSLNIGGGPRSKAWLTPGSRRLATRLLAIFPAIVATVYGGENSANELLLLSQVVLGYTLPCAVIPLIHLSSAKHVMGEDYRNSPLMTFTAWTIALIILGMNAVLLIS